MYLPVFKDEIHSTKFGFGPLHWLKSEKNIMWYQADTEEAFDAHWNNPTTRKILIECGWTKNSITYVKNDMGFRMYDDMSDISPGECDFYLGCSHTFGVGLNVEDTWGWKLSKKNGTTFVNFGWPGGSIEAQYRMLRSWAGILKPRRAFTLGTYLGRREILRSGGTSECLGHWTQDEKMRVVYERTCNDNEIFISSMRAFDAMKAVCMEYNIEFYIPDERARCDIMDVSKESKKARDLLHYSVKWHSQIADAPNSFWRRIA